MQKLVKNDYHVIKQIMNYTKNKFNTRTPHCSKQDGLPIVGLFLIGFGLMFLLDRMNLIPSYWRHIIISWQALLIFIGLINLFKSHARIPGIILILIGSAFLLPEIFDIPFETRQLIWPVLLIGAGVLIVFKARNFKAPSVIHSETETFNGQEKIEEVAIFGGGKRIITSKNLRGGNVSAIFGGLELDLTEAELANDTAVLEVACIFGGVTIIVKPEWDVQVQVTSILGGFDDKRKLYKRPDGTPATKHLIIKGAAIFGGGEVKAY
jgi:predicted membrane protein